MEGAFVIVSRIPALQKHTMATFFPPSGLIYLHLIITHDQIMRGFMNLKPFSIVTLLPGFSIEGELPLVCFSYNYVEGTHHDFYHSPLDPPIRAHQITALRLHRC